jgi:hypothetical protein
MMSMLCCENTTLNASSPRSPTASTCSNRSANPTNVINTTTSADVAGRTLGPSVCSSAPCSPSALPPQFVAWSPRTERYGATVQVACPPKRQTARAYQDIRNVLRPAHVRCRMLTCQRSGATIRVSQVAEVSETESRIGRGSRRKLRDESGAADSTPDQGHRKVTHGKPERAERWCESSKEHLVMDWKDCGGDRKVS